MSTEILAGLLGWSVGTTAGVGLSILIIRACFKKGWLP